MTTTTWTNGAADLDWTNAGNWTNGIPDGTLDTVVPAVADIIAVPQDVYCKSLSLAGYTGKLTGANLHLNVGDGTTPASGTVAINQDQLDVAGLVWVDVLPQHDCTLTGTVEYNGGIYYNTGTTIRVGVTGDVDDFDVGSGYDESVSTIILIASLVLGNYANFYSGVSFSSVGHNITGGSWDIEPGATATVSGGALVTNVDASEAGAMNGTGSYDGGGNVNVTGLVPPPAGDTSVGFFALVR